MKKLFATVLAVAMILACVFVLTSCGGKELVIWVGQESQAYYQGVMEKYVADYEASGEKFPYKVVVQGVDASTAAEAVLKDPQAGPSIFTIPHDNLGKLIGTNPVIAAMTDQDLLAQIEADNSDGYKKVIKNGNFTYAAPYIGQALVLYYDKTKISDEQVKSWEGIMQAAKAASTDSQQVKATTVMGNDSYNLSFLMLARDAQTNETSVKIYEGTDLTSMLAGCYCTGDDTVSNYLWGQRFFNDPNGGQIAGDVGFDVLMEEGKVLSLVGGAWKFASVSAALGDKLGIAQLPTFTITEADAYGTVEAGKVMKSGTFADCKVLCINAQNKVTTENKGLLEKIIMHLSSKEVQEGSFEECNNLPAYKNASSEFEAMKADTIQAQLAAKQVEMSAYGLPQPFGYHNFLNLFFYQKGADTYTQDMLLKRNSETQQPAYQTVEEVKACLEIIENIWKTGKPNG